MRVIPEPARYPIQITWRELRALQHDLPTVPSRTGRSPISMEISALHPRHLSPMGSSLPQSSGWMKAAETAQVPSVGPCKRCRGAVLGSAGTAFPLSATEGLPTGEHPPKVPICPQQKDASVRQSRRKVGVATQ